MKIKLNDVNFAHASTIGNGNLLVKPKDFEWDRSNNYNNINVFTDRCLKEIHAVSRKSKINLASIFEPPVINPNPYHYILDVNENFDLVLTYNKELLNQGKNFTFCPHGGCWVDSKNQKIYNKTKNVSAIFSNKTQTPGHKFRHDVVNKFQRKIDFLAGNGYNQIDDKLDALKDFRYQIVIENCALDYYFTEKIIDCFVTGVIPIYWGCPSIGKFFNLDGFYHFRTIEELEEILHNISEDDYNNKIKYIKENFEIAKEYSIVEDWIYKKIIKDLV